MRSVTFLVKPASSLCDMRCRYCFYHDISDIREVKSMGMMSSDTAEALLKAAFAAVGPGGFVQFTFQGGEPTLAGLEFFRSFMALEEQHRPKDVQVGHSIQTNGLHINEEWAQFLKEHRFLVGLSVDGNQVIHDAHRIDAAGKGTWDRVTAALALLDRYGVEANILCVVSAMVAKNPQKVYASLRKLGDHPLQFIPCLDPLEAQRGSEPHSLKPEAYGRFLCGLFDCWYRDWKAGNYISIRTFDDYLRILMRMPPSTCATSGACGSYLVAEGDGSLYPCDFYDGGGGPVLPRQPQISCRRRPPPGSLQDLPLVPPVPGRLQTGLDGAAEKLLLFLFPGVLRLFPAPAAGNGQSCQAIKRSTEDRFGGSFL